ncbi:MAG TPA: T9SS type A sorting domain-containing protein, partial [Rhodothermia bacterium]|nr:T9SS type A sorting domain-containing protein [Rhodothermia bacterium]
EPDSLRDDAGALITDFDFYHQLADFDSDSDADLFIGNADGVVVYYENVGTPENASFSSEPRILDEIQAGSNNRNIPFFADIDSDGDLDAFIGRFQGGLFFYRNQSEATSIDDHVQPVALTLELGQNYPNPFSALTTIGFRLSDPSRATLRVYDVLGREVKKLDLGMTPAGQHAVRLEVKDLSSGVYFYRLDAAGSSSARRMVVRE